MIHESLKVVKTKTGHLQSLMTVPPRSVVINTVDMRGALTASMFFWGRELHGPGNIEVSQMTTYTHT